MESLSELQNPLLDKTNRQAAHNDYQGYRCDYPSQPYQDSLIGYYYNGTNGEQKTQQFLDAKSLHLAVEAFYRPNFILCKDDVSLHSKDSKSESLETTFTETKDAGSDGASTENPLGGTQAEKDAKIQTVSYDVEDEQGPEYEVRGHTEERTGPFALPGWRFIRRRCLYTSQYVQCFNCCPMRGFLSAV